MSSAEFSRFRVTMAPMTPLQRLAITLMVLAGLVLSLVVIIPLVILMGVLGLGMLLWTRVRRAIGGDRSAREGRRNVRVIQRSN